MAVHDSIMQRHDAETVAHQPQSPPAPIPESERELAVKHGPGFRAILLVAMHDNFRIAVRVEPVSKARQFLAQLHIIENLAVEGDPYRAFAVMDRLRAASEIDEAKAGVGQPDTLIAIEAVSVGTAMSEHANHCAQFLERHRWRRRSRENACYAAHDFLCLAYRLSWSQNSEQLGRRGCAPAPS